MIFEFLAALLIRDWLVAPKWRLWRRDDTDAPGARSGLMVYTDHATGVQYVGTQGGGLTVRVDAEGRPMVAGDGR